VGSFGRSKGKEGSSEGEDGVFVQRSEQEQVILQKLIPIDEATVQAHIIEERSEAIEQIHKGLVEINEMFTDLSKMIKEQEGEVNSICHNAGMCVVWCLVLPSVMCCVGS
jgi:t-SNARE complex subunit (syntaxin)